MDVLQSIDFSIPQNEVEPVDP
ncbi:hypothetical protein HKBW3S44_01855, partial [Candidatus Hakubella thermalkaliphila]